MSTKEKNLYRAKCERRPSCFIFCHRSSVMATADNDDGGTGNQTVSARRRRKAKSLPDDGAESAASASSRDSVAQRSKNKATNNRIKPPVPMNDEEILMEPSHERRSSQPGSYEPNPTGTCDAWIKSPSTWAKKHDQMVMGLPFLMLMLVVMAVYGSVASVVLMITCLLLVGLLRQPPHSREDIGKGSRGKRWAAAKEVDVESEQYKKRVVLEGLLERKPRKTASLASKI